MCGVAGKVTTSEPVDRQLIRRMCDCLVHRGPDAEGMHVEGRVGLGMRRLAIIDLTTGDQPLYSEDRQVVLVLNGEIYNHVALREELRARGHVFSGGSDAEVVVHLWEELGPDCVKRLRGMFAFALWDEREQELFLARDRLGKKPLFYANDDRQLVFGSEPRALLQDPGVPRDVSPEAIDAFLVNQYVPHHLCAFRAMSKIPPGAHLRWRPGREPVLARYWRADYTPKLHVDHDEATARLQELVLDATRVRMMSDVPLGAFLSGGLDSSTVVAALARSSSEPVRTFSVRFGFESYDESRYARAVAEHYSTLHEELEVGPPQPSLLPAIAWHFGEPFADPAAVPTFQLAELTRRSVTVALSGDGGDESFAGYRRYGQLALTTAADRVPMPARRALARALTGLAGSFDGRAPLPRGARLARRLALEPPVRYADLFRYFREDDRRRLYGPALREMLAGSHALDHVQAAWNERAGLDAVDRLMAVDLDTYLPDDLLAKSDVTTMAHSLELRCPLLDQEVVEFAARLPIATKTRRGTAKALLRDAASSWLPAEVLDRPKQGFAVPVEHWLRDELSALPEQVLLDPVATRRGLFDPRETSRLIDEHRAGSDRSHQLWAMINLELWYVTCVDGVPASAAGVPSLS